MKNLGIDFHAQSYRVSLRDFALSSSLALQDFTRAPAIEDPVTSAEVREMCRELSGLSPCQRECHFFFWSQRRKQALSLEILLYLATHAPTPVDEVADDLFLKALLHASMILEGFPRNVLAPIHWQASEPVEFIANPGLTWLGESCPRRL